MAPRLITPPLSRRSFSFGPLLLAALLLFALPAAPGLAAAMPQPGLDAPPPPVLLPGKLAWREIAPGLESLEVRLARQTPPGETAARLTVSPAPAGTRGSLVILRTDPARCEYSLHMASENGARRSLRACVRDYGLDAATNAGMFLPDNLKNTGFMRNATHVNNARIVGKFGAFFLAGPTDGRRPQAVLLEKNELGDNLERKIADYNIAVQNYRLTNARGEALWPESRAVYGISALGRDKQGRILFITAEYRLSPPEFARVALLLPLGANLLMYLEGGAQAGLVIAERSAEPDAPGEPTWRAWGGRRGFPSGLGGPAEIELPNVLGVKSARPEGRR